MEVPPKTNSEARLPMRKWAISIPSVSVQMRGSVGATFYCLRQHRNKLMQVQSFGRRAFGWSGQADCVARVSTANKAGLGGTKRRTRQSRRVAVGRNAAHQRIVIFSFYSC